VLAVRTLCVDTPDLFPIDGPVKGRFVAVPVSGSGYPRGRGDGGPLALCLPKTGAGLRLSSALPGLTQLRRGSTAHLCRSLESHERRYTLTVAPR